ncbi:hypothetical protein PT7_2380 [Pusillimonas sp. T7-7]|nr:hypothetical protein PT7_2380 [Pusillimonas sp. T7-7]
MRAAVQIPMGLALVADEKGACRFTGMLHGQLACQAAVNKAGRRADGYSAGSHKAWKR